MYILFFQDIGRAQKVIDYNNIKNDLQYWDW